MEQIEGQTRENRR